MGSCISKCKSKKPSKKQQSNKQQDQCKCQCIEQNYSTNNTSPIVQDKLVISQAPISSPTKTSLSSPSLNSPSSKTSYPTSSMSSSSSTSSCSSSFLSSASSLASSTSIISSKSDQSFSNDFLWSYVKENPNVNKVITNPRRVSLPTRCQNSGKKPNGLRELNGPCPQRIVVRSSAQKRPRSNSPSNLTRQKSFRRETEIEPNRPISKSGRDMRPMSPSSSRRFSGELSNQGKNMTSSMRRENFYVRPPSPSKSYNGNSRRFNNGYGRSNNLLLKREKEDGIKGVSSKIEELTMRDLVSSQNMDLMPIEDANNPHIALDCFIFL